MAAPTPAAPAKPAAASKPRRPRTDLGLQPALEADPKRREILIRAQRAVDELRQFDAARAEEEKQRTNRKAMVLGRYFLGVMERDETFAQPTLAALEKHLTDKTERELFGLAPSR
jgi:hypothetical protein